MHDVKTTDSKTRQAIWIGAGALLGFIFSTIATMIMARNMPKADLGTFRQLLGLYSTTFVAFSAGMPAVYAFFLPRCGPAQGAVLVRFVMKNLFILGILFGTGIFVLADTIATALNNPDLAIALRAFALAPILLFPTLGAEGILVSNGRASTLFLFVFISRGLTAFLWAVPVIIFSGHFTYPVFGWVLAAAFTLALFVGIVFVVYGKLLFDRNTALSETPRSIRGFAFTIYTSWIAGVIIGLSDHVFVSRYFGVSVYAEYSLGMLELPFVSLIITSSAAILTPVFSAMNARDVQQDTWLPTWNSAILKAAAILYPIVVFCMVYSSEIMTFLYTHAYRQAATYFQLSLISTFFQVAAISSLMISLSLQRYYSAGHWIIAIMIWIMMPLAMALSGTILSILLVSVALKSLLMIGLICFLAQRCHTRLTDMVPFGPLLVLTAHCFFWALALRWALELAGLEWIGPLGLIIVAGILYLPCLALSLYLAKASAFLVGIDLIAAFLPSVLAQRLKTWVP
jgi:O-antigen/teichoic acid export membrane protein